MSDEVMDLRINVSRQKGPYFKFSILLLYMYRLVATVHDLYFIAGRLI